MSSNYAAVPAGWYADPENPGQQRYWDGAAWTAHRAPAATTGQAQPPKASKPMSRRAKWTIGIGAAVLVMASFAAFRLQDYRANDWQPPEGYTKVTQSVAVNLTSDPGYIAAYAHTGCSIQLSIQIDIPANYGIDRRRTLRSSVAVRPGSTYFFEWPAGVAKLAVVDASCI